MTAPSGRLVRACLYLLLVSACGREPAAPMRVGTDVWAGNEMLAVADHAGQLDPARVRRVEFSSNLEVMRALRNGIIEAGALMLDETLDALEDGGGLVILAAVDSSNGSDAILARAPIGTMAELKGRRIGVQINSGSLQLLRRGLAAAGMSSADVTVVNVPPDRHQSAFESGQVDAVVTYDPIRITLVSGGAVDVFNSAAIAGDIVNVLVVSRAYLESHPEQCRALVDAWWAGQRAFQTTPSARAWSADRLGLTVSDLERAFTTINLYDAEQSRALVGGDSSPLLQSARRFHRYMRENGRLSRDVPVDDLFRVPQGWER